jgi:hypothetical protein
LKKKTKEKTAFLLLPIFYRNILLHFTMTLPWKRLIRFEAVDGRILRGEPVLSANEGIDLGFVTEADQLQAKILVGHDIYNTTGNTTLTEETVLVKKILSPLAQSDVPILRCVGLNYAKHSTYKQSSIVS